MGDPEWARDPQFDSDVGRKGREEELDQHLGEWTQNFPAEQLPAMLQGAGIASAVVQTGQDLLADPQLKAREHFRVLNHDDETAEMLVSGILTTDADAPSIAAMM